MAGQTVVVIGGSAGMGRAVFLAEHVFSEMGSSRRLTATAANRQPAFGLYGRVPDEAAFRAFAIGVLRVDGDTACGCAVPHMVSTILPRRCCPSLSRWAAAASARGNRFQIITRSLPSA